MGYELGRHESVDEAIRRVMTELVERATAQLDERVADDPHDAVHECRKACKQIRAAARLVRPALGDRYTAINRSARDAARELAALRDATALAGTFDRLRTVRAVPDDAALDPVTATLHRGRDRAEERLAVDLPAVERSRALLGELSGVVADLELDDGGWDAIGPGLAMTYRRGRRAMHAAIDAPTGEHFHEWRKRAKYTRHHLDLLMPSAPAVLEPLEASFHDLTDALGDAHDLHVLAMWLRADDRHDLDGDAAAAALLAADGARVELETRAVVLGRVLYAEPTDRFVARLGAYWDAWGHGEAGPAGGLADVFGTRAG